MNLPRAAQQRGTTQQGRTVGAGALPRTSWQVRSTALPGVA